MMLPTIKTPEYELTLPISKEVVTYRPFLVREEKMFMMLKEGTDQNHILNNMKKIVSQCIVNGPDVNKISYNDFEFLFLNMRIRSIGEELDIHIKCSKCEKPTPVSVSLEDVVVKVKEGDNNQKKIMINDDVGVICSPMKMQHVGDALVSAERDPITAVIHFIDSVFTKDQVYKFDEVDQKERKAFVDSLSMKVVTEIIEFVDGLPAAEADIKYTCASCGHADTYNVKGLQNFFM
jgi:hypothetical protein|tara:strand:+ start:4874 stop:5578 length:705 start_codon:yes stop_codon:yes gene_type:complete